MQRRHDIYSVHVVSKLARIDAGTRSLLPRPEGEDSWTQQQSAEEIVAMILEHQSSNSTSEYQQGDDKVIPEEHGQQQCFERGRLFCSGYTQGEMAIKMLGVSPFTLAKTIELQAWRGIEPWLTPKILRGGHQTILLPIINSS
jgi:hypothetical protein